MPLKSLKTYRWLSLLVFVAIVTVGVPVAWKLGTSMYSSTAVIHVSPRFVRNLEDDKELEFQSNSQYLQYIEQQVRTVNRFDIVYDALQGLGDRRFDLWQKPIHSDQRAAELLQGALTVKSVRKTYLITVTLEGRDPEKLAPLINAVVEKYLGRASREEVYASDDRISSLDAQRKDLVDLVQEKSAQRIALTEELGLTVFNDKEVNPYDRAVMDAEQALAEARRNRIDADERLATFQRSEGTRGVTALEAYTGEIVAKDPGLNSLKANLNKRRSQLVTRLTTLAKKHPARRTIEREITLIDRELEQAETALREFTLASLFEKRKAESEEAHRIEDRLTNEHAELFAKSRWYASRFNRGINLGIEIDRARKRLNAIEDRIDFLTLESEAPGFVRLASAARQPELPFKGGRKKLMAIFIVLAFGAALVLPIGLDFIKGGMNTPNDLHRVLGFPPIGWLVKRDAGCSEAFCDDQYRRIALTLARDRRTRGTSTFVLTGVKPRLGSSSVALKLGASLNSIGVPTVVVAANPLHADARFCKEGHETGGLAATAIGVVPLDELVLPAEKDLPYRMPIGDSAAARSIAFSGAFVDAKSRLLDRFDIIIFDAPPILYSADAEFLVDHCDATLMLVSSGTVTAGEIKRAGRAVERIAPGAFGAILNRAPIFDGGGYIAELMEEFEREGAAVEAAGPPYQFKAHADPKPLEDADGTKTSSIRVA